MASERINVTMDADTLMSLDAMADAHGMNRSECIRFMVDAMDALGAWNALDRIGAELFAERYGREPDTATSSPSMMLKAANACSVRRD